MKQKPGWSSLRERKRRGEERAGKRPDVDSRHGAVACPPSSAQRSVRVGRSRLPRARLQRLRHEPAEQRAAARARRAAEERLAPRSNQLRTRPTRCSI